ncbi:MAG: sensor histidine kinase [Lactovum sp.]
MKLLKISWKTFLGISLLYISITALTIFFVNQNYRQLDSNRILKRANEIKRNLKERPEIILDRSIKEYDLDTDNTATQVILEGAAYARNFTTNSITITLPIVENGKITSYLAVTDTRTSGFFTTVAIILLSLILWTLSVFEIARRAIGAEQHTKNTIAKIKNIERSPLTQSYLITKDDDPVTIALNHLGDNIQQRILSNQETKENLYEFIEFFQFPIFVYDGRGLLHRSNAAFQNEFSNAKGIDVFSPFPEFLNFLVEKMVHPDIQNTTFYFENINCYYKISFNPLEMINNRYLVVMNDVSQYHQIMQAHRDFTANISSAFIPPLSRIKEDILQLERTETQEEILKEIDWLNELITDTLALTRTNLKIKKSKVQADLLIQEILESFKLDLTDKGLKLELNIQPLSFHSDPKKIQIIFKKLIGNAISYSKNTGTIRISLEKDGKKTVFSVKDSGPGLSEIQKSRIFEEFYSVDLNRSTVSGTGLGLAIVKKNVQELKGKVYIQSELGQGSTFIVKF